MRYKLLLLPILALLNINIMAQKQLKGTVYHLEHKKEHTLPGATIFWLGTTTGTTSDADGNFTLQRIENNNKLVIQHVAYETDTLTVSKNKEEISILMSGGKSLDEVTIRSRDGLMVSIKPIAAQIITQDGLRKAACCNLAESFEQTASVDVEYSDAVTGAKHIQMLGLAGVYSQIMLENTPYIRGLSTPFGFGFVPGSWMESIQVSKGTSSVINGYESITGQINVEFKKPESSNELLFVNLYGDHHGKGELNLNTMKEFNHHLSTMFLLHYGKHFLKTDVNKDGFIDTPLSDQINVMNRWDYHVHDVLEGKTLASFVWENRNGGQMGFNKKDDHLTTNNYGFGTDNKRLNLTTKNGFFFEKETRSIGTILSLTSHQSESFFGLRTYDVMQNSLYANVIYEDYTSCCKTHKLNFGLSYQLDDYRHILNDSNFRTRESVPGAFGQYTYNYNDKFVGIVGMRADWFNAERVFLTPRLHFKWAINDIFSLRGTAGKGYRTTQVYSEHMAIMVSSRQFDFLEEIKPEEAWNAGINFTGVFEMNNKDATVSLDFYRTEFVNQVIIDLETPNLARIYNLNGKSYSNSTQIESILYPHRQLELILAYRFNDVWQTLDNSLQKKALSSPHKAVASINYRTKDNKWQFDLTSNWISKMRLPNTESNPEEYRLAEYSDDYFLFSAQITFKHKDVEYYLGGENLGDYTQKNPIIASDDPFGTYFDSSIVWAPIIGRKIYAGIRYTIFK
ncbi:MAG: TonB-dependent receptor [Bacteroidales bacterium]|jgi:outer membrane receptor for ferrienterochelin and colicin|nr:TonB-dependent receptor [Bacteroidales bacterium]